MNVIRQIEDLIKSVDLRKIGTESKKHLDHIFHEFPEDSKIRTLKWIEEVRTIKEDPELGATQKFNQLEKLDSPEVALDLIKSILTVVIEELPIKKKDLLMTGFLGAGTVLTIIKFKAAIIAATIAKKALPGFLVSTSSDPILNYLAEQLSHEG